MAEKKYEKYLVRKPLREAGGGLKIKGRTGPAYTYMSNDLVPGCNVYIEYGWIYDMPEPNTFLDEHTHDYDEIVMHIGADYKNPEDLGAEMEFTIGGEPLRFDTTTALFIPRGVPHGPLTWHRVNKPHIEFVIVLGGGTLATAAPGGFKE